MLLCHSSVFFPYLFWPKFVQVELQKSKFGSHAFIKQKSKIIYTVKFSFIRINQASEKFFQEFVPTAIHV